MLAPLVLFCYLFQFPLNPVATFFSRIGVAIPTSLVSSSTILLIPFLFIVFVNKKYRLMVYNLIIEKQIIKILFGMICLILMSGILVLLRGTNDFSFMIMLLPQLSQLFIGILILPYILRKSTSVIKLCIEVFFIQSLVELLSMISPAFLSATNIFRISQSITRSMNLDGGARATGIAVVSYFGLAVAFALIEFLFIYFWKEIEFSNIFIKYLVLVMLIFGGLVAGRTSIIGVGFGFFVVILKGTIYEKKEIRISKWTTTKKKIITVVFILATGLVLAGIITSTSLSEKIHTFILKNTAIQSFKTFIMKLFVNYQETGSLSDNSTEALKNMYFPITGHTFIFGDAMFTNLDQSYYLHTDGGYMRQILFGGIFGFLSLVWYQIQFLKLINQRILSVGLFVLLCVLNYKGIVLGTAVIVQSVLLVLWVDNRYKDRGILNEQG